MSVYDIVTERILKRMEETGVPPWRATWNTRPINLVSRKPYRGVNVLLLAFSQHTSPYWLTFNQAKKLGGTVKKGEHAETVVFYKPVSYAVEADEDSDTSTPREKRAAVLQYYNVFNVEQCELPEGAVPVAEPKGDDLNACKVVIAGYFASGPQFEHGGLRACYIPAKDLVRMPGQHTFDTYVDYYSTLFHESIHSTGHSTRLARPEITRTEDGAGQRDEAYSYEELVAECGAMFLLAHTGALEFASFDNSIAYLQGWASWLKDHKRAIVSAASAAQKACDYVLGIQQEVTDGA